MSNELRYSFDDQLFDIGSNSIKQSNNKSYAELTYPIPNERTKPVLKYKDAHYVPVKILIVSTGNANYDVVLETQKLQDETIKIFVAFKLTHSENEANGPLTDAFNKLSQLNEQSSSSANINLNNLFSKLNNTNINYSTSPNHLTVHGGSITTKLADISSKLITSATIGDIIPSGYTSSSAAGAKNTQITLTQSSLTVRQRCTRSSDMASPSTSVVAKKMDTENYLTNLLFIIIMALTIAAFFPTVYTGMVCFFVSGDKPPHSVIHIIYLMSIMLLIIPLFVRGFKDGDLNAQIWGIGLLSLCLIFYVKYAETSTAMQLKCGDKIVDNIPLSEYFTNLPEYLKKPHVIVLFLLMMGASVVACVYSKFDEVYKGMMGTICVFLVVILNFINK